MFACVRLRDKQVINVHATLGGISRIEGMFHVNESGRATEFLRLGNDVLADGGLTGRFRTEDFSDAPARDAANPKRQIEGEGTGRDGLHHHAMRLSKTHN